MPLRVWLPLLGNLDNQGLSDITVVNNGATVDNSGKLGKCYSFGTSTSYLTLSNDAVNKCTTECSLSFWLNITSWNTSYATYFQAGLGSAPWAHYIFGVLRSGAGSNLCFTISDGSSASNASYATPNLELNTWYHLTFVYKTGHCLIYIDGELYKDYATTIVPNFSGITKTTVGACNNGSSYQTNCKLNDVRIYDNALSPKEISEIAKGLVCHYPLNNPNVTDNLILNGFGQDGLLGWSNSSYSTTEIPPNQPTIKASYTNSNTTLSYIPISHDTTYTISEYIKATSGSTGNTYPSLLPYDIDKKFIGNNNCLDGFNATYKTTLSQPLKKGDTVIHATNLSAWTTATTNHYYYVAIFGYKDSTGHIYADMTYTADSPSFGSMTDKSRIDKTNNTVTLLSAYTGEDRPAGTTICQATAGSAYVYPYGGIPVTTITDWTFKSATVNPITHNRLKWAKYVRYLAYPNAYHAGIQLVDNNANKVVYDSSGYNNIGKATTNIFPSADTARNTTSIRFTSGSHIALSNLSNTASYINSYTFAWWAKFSYSSSTMMWGYSNGNRLNLYISGNKLYFNTGDGASNPFNGVTISTTQYGDNQWHHFAMTGDGTTAKLYIDGEFQANATTYKSLTGTNISFNGWDTSATYNFNGCMSDFRLYATPLSAEDIKKLYNTPESIAKNGSVLTQGEFVEV